MKSKSKQRGSPPSSGNTYLDWAVATNFRYLKAGRWLPLLVEFDATSLPRPAGPAATPGAGHSRIIPALQIFVQLTWLGTQARAAVRVPELFAKQPGTLAGIAGFHFCVLLVDRNLVNDVFADPGWRSTIVDLSLGPPLDLPEDLIQALASASAADQLTGADCVPTADGPCEPERVAIAVIDEGIAFAHERFRNGLNTRIEHYWNQNGFVGPFLAPNSPGIELNRAQIDAALAAHAVNGRVNEDLLYQSLNIVDFSRDGFKAVMHRRSHGTAVLDLAAGVPPDPTPSGPPILGVELPEAAVADPVGTPLYPLIVLGIMYVLLRANQMRGPDECLPIVLNLSYGPHQGPHDGSSLFERVIDFFVAVFRWSRTPLTVVLAAGNFRQARVHACCTVQPGATQRLAWRVQPEDVTPSLLELWLPQGAESAISVTVTSPLGNSVTVSATSLPQISPGPNGEVFRATFVPPTTAQPRASVVVILQATATDPPLQATLQTAPPGVWFVDVTNTGAAAVVSEGWIWRDGHGTRRPLGRQSYFDDANYVRFDAVTYPTYPLEYDSASRPSYVARGGTLSGIATGRRPYVIGGYRRLAPAPNGAPQGTPASYSSMGPVSGGLRIRPAPDLLAPSDDSLVCHGVLTAGTRSGSTVPMNGTSVAAPRVARWFVQWIGAGGPPPPPRPALPALQPPTFMPPNVIPANLVPAVAGGGLFAAPPTRMLPSVPPAPLPRP